jgi:nucleoside-diphosphate-sugar epimerase
VIVAITGGSGFIGNRLARRHLAAGDTVRVLSRGQTEDLPGCEWHQGDLAGDLGPLATFARGADVLYHCAAEVRNPDRMIAVNVDGTRSLLRAAAGNIGRWIGLSSVGVYGAFRQGIVTEDTPLRPQGAYETSKAEADHWVSEAARESGLVFTLLRPSNVYGPDMRNRSVFQMVKMIDRGWFFFIGRPGASANYVHVENVVEALVLCATRPESRGRVYNLSDFCTMEEFVGWISAHLRRAPPRLRVREGPVRLLAGVGALVPRFPLTPSRVDALTNRTRYPSSRIERELGYHAPRSLASGLGDVVCAWRTKK